MTEIKAGVVDNPQALFSVHGDYLTVIRDHEAAKGSTDIVDVIYLHNNRQLEEKA